MFDIGWGELVVIGVVALIAIGPKELPGALRSLGQWMGKIRRMAAEFQNQFQEAMREAEMADLKKQVDALTSGFDPIRDIESAIEDKPRPAALAGPAPAAESPAAAETPSAYAPGAEAPAGETSAPPSPPTDPSSPPPAGPEQALADEAPGAAKPGDRPA